MPQIHIERTVTYKKAFINKKTRDIFYYEKKGRKFLKFSNKTKKDMKTQLQKAKKDKLLIPIYIDMDTLAVFTEKSIKKDEPKQVGIINDKGKYVKK